MRRGYALVIVVLLTVVVGLTAAVGMQRQSSESLSVARQMAAYQQHHAARGMQEAIGVWLRAVNARTVAESLGDGGHALDISLADGSTLSVYLHDGQGTALADLTALPQANIDDAGAVLRRLATSVSEPDFRRFTREGGPMAVSVGTAPEAVLTAVAEAFVVEGSAESLVRELVGRRRSGLALDRAMLTEACAAAGITGTERSTVLRMLVIEPELWWATAVLRAPGRGVTARYGGLVQLRSAASSGGIGNAGGSFLTWVDLGVGRERRPPPPGVPEVE